MILFLGLCMSYMVQPVAGKDSQRVIKPSDQSIPESIFRKHFKEYVCRHLRKTESDVVVSRFKVKGNGPVPAGTVSFKLFQKGRTRLQGHVKLIAEINVSGQVKNEILLSGYIDVFESVVCTSRNLKRGEVIEKDDIYLNDIFVAIDNLDDLKSTPGSWYSAPDDLLIFIGVNASKITLRKFIKDFYNKSFYFNGDTPERLPQKQQEPVRTPEEEERYRKELEEENRRVEEQVKKMYG